jgi:serine/threonine protein kinase
MNGGSRIEALGMEFALAHGEVMGGRYRIERVLGQGGFAVTYLALDEQLQRWVAVKELFPEGSLRDGLFIVPGRTSAVSFPATKSRFVEEARTVASLRHKNVVTIYEVLEANNTAYLVMEFIDGWSVADAIAANGRFTSAQVRTVLNEGLDALAYLHDHNVLHRDITPANVMLERSGRVVLIDFGSARRFAARTSQMTKVVTAGYSPLEQYSDGDLTPAADLYSLSAMGYFAVIGSPPPAATDRVANDVKLLEWPADFNDAGLSSALTTGLTIRPEGRPQSAASYRHLLNGDQVTTQIVTGDSSAHTQLVRTQIVTDSAVHSAPEVVHGTPSAKGRSTKLIVAIAIAGLLAVGVTAAVVSRSRSLQHAVAPAATTAPVQTSNKRKPSIPSTATTITAAVATAPATAAPTSSVRPIPDVVGSTELVALQMLADSGLQASVTHEFNTAKPKGYVLRQTPEAGTKIGGNVALIVSNGSPPPDPIQTSPPQSPAQPTEGTRTQQLTVTDLEGGLFCRDLRAKGFGFDDAVSYWTYWQRPDNMDIDLDGVRVCPGFG